MLALDFFHQKKVVHRDIKLENILINQIDGDHYETRIADFGLSCFTLNDEILTHKCGTPGYVAPEVLDGVGYTYNSDVFSLASVFFNLLTGRYLFSGENNKDVLAKNLECQTGHITQYLTHISRNGKELLFWMLEHDRLKRPSARDAL